VPKRLSHLLFTFITPFFLPALMWADETAPPTRNIFAADKIPPRTRTVWAVDKTAKAVVTFKGTAWQSADARGQAAVWPAPGDSGETPVGAAQDRPRWTGDLVNIPHRCFISSQGKSLVTMDRWDGAASDSLVFYDSSGAVVKRYGDPKNDLLTSEEIPRIGRSASTYWWSDGAYAQFTADGEHFLLWLGWGRMLVFNSGSGDPIDPEMFRRDAGQRQTVLEMNNRLKRSDRPDDRIAAARYAGWLRGDAALAILKELLEDPYYKDGLWKKLDDPRRRFGNKPMWGRRRRYPVRKAAAEEIHIHFGSARGVIEEWIVR
jgi:hypothetical protein